MTPEVQKIVADLSVIWRTANIIYVPGKNDSDFWLGRVTAYEIVLARILNSTALKVSKALVNGEDLTTWSID